MFETFKNAWKIVDLRKKLIYTLMIILVFRIGAAIPVPFLDPTMIAAMIGGDGNLLGYLNMLTGGAFAQCTLFALSISPYITSSIVIQLLTVALPSLENLAKEGEEGRKQIQKITRYTTVALALLQASAYYIMLRRLGAVAYTEGAYGIFAGAVIITTFVGGAMFLVWLGEQIDVKGIGNGISMILFAGIVSRGPALLTTMYGWVLAAKTQPKYMIVLPVMLLMFLGVIIFIVIMTAAERRIPVQYSQRVVGRKTYGGQSTHIPIKVTMSGVLPVIFASSLLAIPGTIKGFIDAEAHPYLTSFLSVFDYTSIFYAVIYFILIMAFNYFYVAVQYNPVEISNNLRKNSGMIPGIRPGRPTADFLGRVVSKVTVFGGLFLAVICIGPIILTRLTGVNIALGGTSVIILVGVAQDTVRSLESQMMMRHYKGFLE